MADRKARRPGADGRAVFLLLLALGFILYSPSFHGKWVYDDNPAIVANDALEETSETALRALTGRRTLTDFTFALNRAAGGLDPFGYHIVNIAIHVFTAFLVFLLGRRLARRATLSTDDGRFASMAAALLFLCHPLNSQAVAYTAQRYTSLTTLFYLAALELYLAAREKRSVRMGALSFAFAFFAMRCKEIAFTLPLAVFLAELFFHRGKDRKLFAPLPFLILLPLIPLSLLWSDEGVGRNLTTETLAAFRETPDLGRVEYLATQSVVLLRYVALLFFPAGLTVDREAALMPGFGHIAPIAATALLAAITFAAWKTRGRFPLFLAGWTWFLLTSSVESSIIPIRDVMVEHRMYLPSVGMLIALAAALSQVPKRTIVLVLLLVPLSLTTWGRAKTWADPILLWEDAREKSPGNPRPYVNLALAHRRGGDFQRAVDLYEKALSLDGTLVEAMYGLGLSLKKTGRPVAAIEAFQRARSVADDYGPVYDAEAQLLHEMGRTVDGVSLLQRGIERCGAQPLRLHLLGDMLVELHDPEGAAAAYRKALQLNPQDERAAIGIARTLVESGNPEGAVEVLTPFYTGYRGSAHVWNALGMAHFRMGDRLKAEHDFRYALQLDPNLAEARANLKRIEAGLNDSR